MRGCLGWCGACQRTKRRQTAKPLLVPELGSEFRKAELWAAQGCPGVTRKAENLGWSRVSREERRFHNLCLQDIL